ARRAHAHTRRALRGRAHRRRRGVPALPPDNVATAHADAPRARGRRHAAILQRLRHHLASHRRRPLRRHAHSPGHDLRDRVQGLPPQRGGHHLGHGHASSHDLRSARHTLARQGGGRAMNRTPAWNIVLGVVVGFFTLLIGLPFWWVVTGSIKAPQEIIARTPTFFPHSFTLQHFDKLLSSSDYPVYLANSLIIASASTVITLL